MEILDLKEREWDINRNLQEIEEHLDEFRKIQKDLDGLEEESYWQNTRIKEINDTLLDNYPKDTRLQSLLVEKEEILQQKVSYERCFWEDARDILSNEIRKKEQQEEDCKEELLILERNKNLAEK